MAAPKSQDCVQFPHRVLHDYRSETGNNHNRYIFSYRLREVSHRNSKLRTNQSPSHTPMIVLSYLFP